MNGQIENSIPPPNLDWRRVTRDVKSTILYCNHGDHSPDNVKFPDSSRHSSAALGMLSVTHIMPVLVLLSVVGV